MNNSSSAQVYSDQVVSAIVQDGILKDEKLYVDTITRIQLEAAEKAQSAQDALNQSLDYVENVRDFVSDPEHILGPLRTKHGEIAEHVEVEIGNAKRVMARLDPNRTFEGVGRTAPEDYVIDGVQVQSKFINGANKSLDAVLGHMRDYPEFTPKGGYYQIPKDQYDTINRVLAGDTDGLSTRTINKCKEAVATIEHSSGKGFSEVVRPGLSNYKDIQLGTIDNTLDGYEHEFRQQNAEENASIQQERREKTEAAAAINDPSWGKAAQAGLASAVITGTTMAGIKIYKKIHGGQKITEFTLSDWKEVGYDFAKGGIKGGVSGIAIYWLTAKEVFSAPFAGAVVSTSMGVASLYKEYKKGSLSFLDFSESVNSLSVEAGIAAIGAAVGQALIPVPVLGAVVGSAVSKAALEITKHVVGQREEELIRKMQQEYDTLVAKLNAECEAVINEMESFFSQLGGYINAALNPCSAARLYGSVELARFLHVPEVLIIHNISELDTYMVS